MFVVKVLSQTSGKWRFVREKSLQACFALVDGLVADYRIVKDHLILLSQTACKISSLDASTRKPLRDYRYLQGKRTTKQVGTSGAAVTRILDLQIFPRCNALPTNRQQWQRS